MNKKKVIIIVISILILLLAAGLILFLAKGKKKGGSGQTKLFSDSDYPCDYKTVKDGVELTLDGSKTPGLKWEYEVKRDGIFEVTVKSEENNGKITYLIKPVSGGSTDITFKKTDSLAGYSFDAANVSLNLFSLITEKGDYEIVVSEEASLDSTSGTKAAEETDYPFLILNSSSGYSQIIFPNGSSDWMYNDPTEKTRCQIGFFSDGVEVFTFYDPEAERQLDYTATNSDAVNIQAYETVATISSEKFGLTEYIKVKVNEKGGITLSLSEKPKD